MRRVLPVLLACLFGCGGTTVVTVPVQVPVESKATETKPTGLDPDKVEFRKIDLGKFIEEWEANPSAANDKYNGKPVGVETSGKIATIGVNKGGRPICTIHPLGDEKRIAYVVAISDETRASLNQFKIGDVVKVKACSAGVATSDTFLDAYRFMPAE